MNEWMSIDDVHNLEDMKSGAAAGAWLVMYMEEEEV